MDYWCSVSCNVAHIKTLMDVLQSNIPYSINLNTIMYTHYTTASHVVESKLDNKSIFCPVDLYI